MAQEAGCGVEYAVDIYRWRRLKHISFVTFKSDMRVQSTCKINTYLWK